MNFDLMTISTRGDGERCKIQNKRTSSNILPKIPPIALLRKIIADLKLDQNLFGVQPHLPEAYFDTYLTQRRLNFTNQFNQSYLVNATT